MTFFVCNSKADVQAWNQEAEVGARYNFFFLGGGGGCKGRRTGVAVTAVSSSLILGGWVEGWLTNNILTFLSCCTR